MSTLYRGSVASTSAWFLGVALGMLGNLRAEAQTFTPDGQVTARLQKLVDGLSGELTGNTANTRRQNIPIDTTPIGDGRQLVLTLGGHVRLLQADGTLVPGAYLDTTNGRTLDIDFLNIGALSITAQPGFLDPRDGGYGKFYTITSELPSTELPANLQAPADFSLVVTANDSYVIDNVVQEWTINPGALAALAAIAWPARSRSPYSAASEKA